ncbi:MAG: hypothetical protein MUF24_01930 [Chitinophagaceae bacterium]|nr:hypothetical protein [Chitinophagaceae bacterium]
MSPGGIFPNPFLGKTYLTLYIGWLQLLALGYGIRGCYSPAKLLPQALR